MARKKIIVMRLLLGRTVQRLQPLRAAPARGHQLLALPSFRNLTHADIVVQLGSKGAARSDDRPAQDLLDAARPGSSAIPAEL